MTWNLTTVSLHSNTQISVKSGAILNFGDSSDYNKGLTIMSGGQYDLSGDVSLSSLTVNGTSMSAGTYAYSDFQSAGLGSAFVANGGTLTVIPEPATLGLFMVSSAGIVSLRRHLKF